MICPKCGEVNSSNFLFCGMCGTILEPVRRATAPSVASTTPRAAENPAMAPSGIATSPAAPAIVQPTTVSSPAIHTVPAISGPSLLGLDGSSGSSDVDDLRDRAFSGLASYGRSEEPKSAGKEILLTVLLLAALGGAGWWTYKNYIHASGVAKQAPATEAANAPAEDPAPKPTEKAEIPPATSEKTSETTPEKTTDATATPAPVDKAPAPEARRSAEEAAGETPKPATPVPIPARHDVSATRVPATKPAPPPDTGDAMFRRGESYLYGRNGTADCGNALRYLKLASDKQHAKARSMMGTMYATGHCVTRDLPSSYRWFALALQADPNNSVLEKNLSVVWNQMTPPERQMATKHD